jgi:signal transduction histidine kinase
LLDFSRIEAGRVQAVYEPTDLSVFTAELASVFRSAIERAGMQLVVDCPALSQPAYYQLVGNREILGKPVREAVPEAEGQGFFELLDEVYQTGEPFVGTGMRIMLQRQPGQPPEERHLDFVYQALRDPDGSITGIFVQGVDLTKRKQAEEALREADRRKDEFLAMLSHELRNPLAPISNALQLLHSGQDNTLRQEVLSVLDRQVGTLTRLVDDLLDVSRVTTGRIQLHQADVDLNALAQSAADSFRPQMAERQHEFSLSLSGMPLSVHADPTRLE